jgi:polysaccharide pyruvyl transferase WcaK-like protein
MRILVENGCYGLLNMGDVAMLQVAVARLSHLWPDAVIEVVTARPDLLAIYCPHTRPIPVRGRTTWLEDKRLLGGRLYRLWPNPIDGYLSKFDRRIRFRWPLLAYRWISLTSKFARSRSIKDVATFLQAVLEADLVIVAGGGNLTDVFARYATRLLDILGLATRYGKVTTMFGQGIGPIQNRLLLAKAKAVLPSLDLIAMREQRAGLPLLKSLGTTPERVVVTGDDAIELAYKARDATFGSGIGVNLRIASYSEVHGDHLEVVRTTLCAAAQRYRARIIPVPISHYADQSDPKAIRELLYGYDDASDGGEHLDSPSKVFSQISDCRLVVTGSYHAAVFALAQGIPVVGLVKSPFYIDKFLGLADQFGVGCDVISLDDPRWPEKLSAAIDAAWGSAEHVRPHLLEAARQQIACSRAAYQRVHDLMMARNMAS